jgi:hypothetical protein
MNNLPQVEGIPIRGCTAGRYDRGQHPIGGNPTGSCSTAGDLIADYPIGRLAIGSPRTGKQYVGYPPIGCSGRPGGVKAGGSVMTIRLLTSNAETNC